MELDENLIYWTCLPSLETICHEIYEPTLPKKVKIQKYGDNFYRWAQIKSNNEIDLDSNSSGTGKSKEFFLKFEDGVKDYINRVALEIARKTNELIYYKEQVYNNILKLSEKKEEK